MTQWNNYPTLGCGDGKAWVGAFMSTSGSDSYVLSSSITCVAPPIAWVAAPNKAEALSSYEKKFHTFS